MKTPDRRIIAAAMIALLVISAGCGTILYPDRANSPHTNRLDGAVMLMDCAWFLVGIIPGAVALIVDFSTGAIYFGYGDVSAPDDAPYASGPQPAPGDYAD